MFRGRHDQLRCNTSSRNASNTAYCIIATYQFFMPMPLIFSIDCSHFNVTSSHFRTQFLCLKYYLAKVHTQQNNLLERKTFLDLARTHFRDYLEQCAALRIIEDDVLGAEDVEVSNTSIQFCCCYCLTVSVITLLFQLQIDLFLTAFNIFDASLGTTMVLCNDWHLIFSSHISSDS